LNIGDNKCSSKLNDAKLKNITRNKQHSEVRRASMLFNF